MPNPKQRVVLYRHGLRKKTPAEYANDWKLRQPGHFECPECGRAVKKGATGNLKKHYSDFPNRIHCPAGIDKQCEGNGIKGPRGPYGPRKTKRVVDVDRKPVESLQPRRNPNA